MNKIVASLGMVALGAASIQSVSAQDTSKFWNISATLRGFYDDNRLTVNDDSPGKIDSYGFQVSPAIGLNWSTDGTVVQLGYVYSLKWYEADFQEADPEVEDTDSTHTFRAGLDHAFSERYRIALNDSFVIGQEPDALRGDGEYANVPFRANGDNIRNYAAVGFDADLTELFGLTLGYNNAYFNYDREDLSRNLDRMEHTGTVMGRWQAMPETELSLGYKYRQVNYDEIDRDRQSHIVFVGASHSFRPDLRAAAQVGVEFAEFDSVDESEVSPYANANLTYTYLPQSFIQLGVSHQRNATDILGDPADPVMDTETTLFYAHLRHQIVPRLFADASGQIQNSSFSGGAADGDRETFYLLGLQLEYELNNYLSTHVGYNYDNLDSDIAGREYDRNRVYIGVTARY
jgi:hypothetical protein